MTGKRFGRLVALKIADKKSGQYRWLCQCDCGNQSLTFGFSLRNGDSKSCGCVAAEKSKERWKNPTVEMFERLRQKAKKTHNKSKHPAYQVWADMKGRCLNQRHKWYPSYGGRGITVCERWIESFENFWNDLGQHWVAGLQMGRIDNDLGYSPTNCRWETPEQQQNNKSNNRIIETPSGFMTISQAARQFGLSHSCIRYRVEMGYPMHKLFQPSERQKS